MRAVLLDAALEVLRRDGAASLTVRNITREAGCSTTGVYTYFGGKTGLVEAIYLDGFESFDRAGSDRLDADDMLGAGRAYRRWALDNPMHYLVMFGRAVPDFEPSADALERAGRSFQALVEGVRRAGAGEAAPSAAYHVFATVHGYVMLELVSMRTSDRDELDSLYEAGLAAVMRAIAVP
jgi:AcrR family transcriptional regulator